ncbi:hypothetical protein SBOR_7826 [Sclerotinia borealis F-4128]|uniref:ubiquitinyl hydrolase 1 n=1 Tax=Sclerotinia borealis (strain F-4128) TaxID=1432307 RepID=W9C7Q9_SCLBF|nr:hypothetical protein SBOR_7826 [Sclerotinia borealis F-4128]
MASSSTLTYVIDHIFLPPKLPQKDDNDFEKDLVLMKECKTSLSLFQAYWPSQEHWRWVACAKMLREMIESRDPCGDMISERLENSLDEMKDKDALAFQIRGQNAGLIIRKSFKQVSFESFELSPTNESVITTKGRLRRRFPGPAIAVGLDKIADSSFREALAHLLTNLDINTPNESWPVATKAKSQTIEVRDTINPKFVTEMLTGILRGIGQPLDVTRIYKRTRDDVLWNKAFKPWRRSPNWLLLRVALQTSLIADSNDDHERYKSFMVFFMARILENALQLSLPSDILFIMAAKISRRVLKLDLRDDPPWMKYIHGIIKATHEELAKRWDELEQETDPLGSQKGWSTSQLSFETDTRLSLSNLRPYLDGIPTRPAISSHGEEYSPECTLRIDTHSSKFPQREVRRLNSGNPTHLALMDIELWVKESLNKWLNSNLYSKKTCSLLAELIQDYTKAATSTYAKSPEDISLMLLTTVDLWVALDRCATHHEPLLKQYKPGFPLSLFDPLLLPKRAQMDRLDRIEKYIKKRDHESTYSSSLIFQDINEKESFAVQYFEQSFHHQKLCREIETSATYERSQKKNELVKKKAQYLDLIQRSESMDHEEVTRWKKNRIITFHPSYCKKCQLKNEANGLQIGVHEWPLPYIELEAKSTVFELDVPIVINHWRDITYTLLVDIFSPSWSLGNRKVYHLRDYKGLCNDDQLQTTRLQLASDSKPFVVSHYRIQKIPQATETNVCVNNGLHYSLYDSKSSKWTSELLNRSNVRNICTFQLPSGSYKTLQWTLNTTFHTPNEVLARQNECSRTLDQNQFYAFGMMRSGHRLQWRNLARELTARILNFSHEETYMLVAQTAWQAGCSSTSPCRESHIDLKEEEFGISLLSAMENVLGTVEGNWQGTMAVRTCIILAVRLLSLSPYTEVQNGCYRLLGRARECTLRWTRDLGEVLGECQNAEESKTLSLRALEVALTCHSTFEVKQGHLSQLLRSNEDIAVITECCIVIHERCPATTESLPQSLKIMLLQYEKLSHFLEPELRRRILRDSEGIDRTIQRIWAGYLPSNSWATFNRPNERWLMTNTSSVEEGYSSKTVHYNILDGSLLVDGLPLTRVPRSYELHETYRRLFGEKVLEVIPSTMEGMMFEMRNEIDGQQVHFQMFGTELIIRTRRQRKICELVPASKMRNDFPRAFIEDYAHWLDIDTGKIEWRPLRHAWTSCSKNWQMRVDRREILVLSNGSQKMIDIHSATARIISKILSPLEQETHIHIALNCDTKILEVQLPRLKLDFFLKDAQSLLESKQFRGMVVDKNQSIGAFTGLVNKLVLHQADQTSRCVLVPYGNVSFTPQGHHVQVTIDMTPGLEVKYHSYQLDNLLGRLVGNGSLQSRLFKIYLHALTSHCLIDRLTRHTGTEQALHDLAGAATRSFVELEPVDIELLEKIAQLTPQRQFYPKYLQVTQQVEWKLLSPLSQHCEFHEQVISILDQAKSFQIFQEHRITLPSLGIHSKQFLRERAAIRESSFQVHGFGAVALTADDDKIYDARDQCIDTDRELRTCQTSRLVNDWSKELAVCPQLLSKVESWTGPLKGPEFHDLILGFDLKWLEDPTGFLPSYWCTLHKVLSQSVVKRDKYKVMVLLSTLSYSRYANQELILTLLAFATSPRLRTLQPPHYPMFQLVDGYEPVEQKLVSLAVNHARDFINCPEYNLIDLFGDRQQEYERAIDEHARIFARNLIAQWPTTDISTPTEANLNTYIKVQQAVESASLHFQSWHRNAEFQEYIQQVQAILDDLNPKEQHLQDYSIPRTVDQYNFRRPYINFDDLMSTEAPLLPIPNPENFEEWMIRSTRGSTNQTKIKELLAKISSNCSTMHEEQYAADLAKSLEALSEESSVKLKDVQNLKSCLQAYFIRARHYKEDIYNKICENLQTGLHPFLREAQMLPRLSPISILSHLARGNVTTLPCDWKMILVQYGLSITSFQYAKRLLASTRNKVELLSELENPGHQNWNPMQHPQRLLLEIESNILIRQPQAAIAQEMVSPSSGSNSVMQLNMGQGKTSVIVPLSAEELADGIKLVRVIVLKSLATQMFQTLVEKLGGMLNRRIVYMPISRSLSLNVHQGRQICQMYRDCKENGSILLLQPEHLLSYELMGFDRLLSGELELGKILIESQDWLYANSRDILDESDEILSIRRELIYTIGVQRAIDFSPERWNIIQYVLEMLSLSAKHVLEQFPHGLEVIPSPPGGLPRLRILQTAAGEKLLENVARQLCENGLKGVPVWTLSEKLKTALFMFLTDPSQSALSLNVLQKSRFWSESIGSSLLLLKGLFAHGILRFVLEQKRWRVNYGLDPSRSMLAVPYHAKDSPEARSEFSHPDTTIVLTCLSYYYSGLSDQQIYSSFAVLLQSDDAQEKYDRWVEDSPELPGPFKHITGVNLSDAGQCSRELFPPLRFSKGIINFYLSVLVFPKEMKEFPHKLSSSGWDIARKKSHPTTGFSGTNDSRYVLPLSIDQRDSPKQLSTNAAMLDCLLRPENSFIDIEQFSATGVLDAEVLLGIISNLRPQVRVIIDVGAQVLELENEEMAKEWLSRVPESQAQAAIFFDNRNEIWVLSRDGRKEPLLMSPFSKQMDQCLVYLDESHTRGTDLKLPPNYRAIVTLGPGLVKDRLVQACMRMRKLGNGQSVVLCSSMEVQRKILECSGRTKGDIEIVDVLRWSVRESCTHTNKMIPLWAIQGMRHQNRRLVFTGSSTIKDRVERILEPEAQTLQQRYGDEDTRFENPISPITTNDLTEDCEKQINDIRTKCKKFEVASLTSATCEEEQERELSPENEREQQVELPPPLTPCPHIIHKDVRQLAVSGVLSRSSKAFLPAFQTLRSTTAIPYYDSAWPNDLLVTADFVNTVQAADTQPLDDFLRPVHWIVSCKRGSIRDFVILSPYEAQELLPSIKQYKKTILHVYSPRLSASVPTLEDLKFCAIPSVPASWSTPPISNQLNIFAGQLYIQTYEDYLSLCSFLGICSHHLDNKDMEIGHDGFVSPEYRTRSSLTQACPFRTSPVPFVRTIMMLRRKGQSISFSHMGRIFNGELIVQDQFSR